MGPGSAAHHAAESGALRSIRGTRGRQNARFDFQTAKVVIASGIGLEIVIARSEATKQSIITVALAVDCFASLAMTVSTLRSSQ